MGTRQGNRRTRPLPAEVAESLERAIREGRMAPGERLPTEAELAGRFQVSRGAIREAIAELRSARLVHTRQGLGSFVADRLPRRTVFSLPASSLDGVELNYVYEIRSEVEAGAAALAARHRNATDLELMRDRLAALDRAVRTDSPAAHHDMAFHRSIAAATGNRFFTEFLDFISARVVESISTTRRNTARTPGRAQLVQHEHQAIFDAVAAGEPEEARAAMRAHLANARKRLGLTRQPVHEKESERVPDID